MPARSAKPHFEKILLICTEKMDEIGDCLVRFFYAKQVSDVKFVTACLSSIKYAVSRS